MKEEFVPKEMNAREGKRVGREPKTIDQCLLLRWHKFQLFPTIPADWLRKYQVLGMIVPGLKQKG
jgi:hypothetical protein